jgi:phosphatidate cytidylyltransferase
LTGLLSRILVGAALLPVALGAVWLGGWWLFVLVLVGGLLAMHELTTLMRGARPFVLAGYAGLFLTLLGAELGGVTWFAAGWLATIFLSFVLYGFSAARPSAIAAFGATLLGVVWVGGGLAHAILLRDLPDHGRLVALTVLIAVFADDTAAYVFGRALGRHRLAPAISPKKSWEGFVAGTLAAILAAFFALYEERAEFLEVWEAVVLGGVVALAGACGDLFESALKRDVGVKDSGRLLAGHGGMLDRMDSLLWALPAAFYTVLGLT